jgi:hypothetical protein
MVVVSGVKGECAKGSPICGMVWPSSDESWKYVVPMKPSTSEAVAEGERGSECVSVRVSVRVSVVMMSVVIVLLMCECVCV